MGFYEIEQEDCVKSIVLTIVILTVCSVPVFADDNGVGKSAAVAERIVFVDPETGKMISGPIESDESLVSETRDSAQSRSISLSGVASKPQLMPDGSRKIEFNGQFMLPIKVEIDSDGNVRAGHHIEASLEGGN